MVLVSLITKEIFWNKKNVIAIENYSIDNDVGIVEPNKILANVPAIYNIKRESKKNDPCDNMQQNFERS